MICINVMTKKLRATLRMRKHRAGYKNGFRTHGLQALTAEQLLLKGAKNRAKANILPFDLSVEDIIIPEFCPVFGTRLAHSTTGKIHDNSPSLDKIIPTLGYVYSNVWVLSARANRLKGDGTLAELKQLVAALEQKEMPCLSLLL